MKKDIIIFLAVLIYTLIIVINNRLHRLQTRYLTVLNKQAIDDINDLIKDRNQAIETSQFTHHLWNETIDESIKLMINKLKDDIINEIGSDMVCIPEMTELYYSSKGNQNSDKQFVSTHMDGPFHSCQVYRALVVISGNKNIDTCFADEPLRVNLKKYDVLLFDYNNTPHYIEVNDTPNDDTQRIVLKLHFRPQQSPVCGELLCKYARETRSLFETNKQEFHLSGMIAMGGLHYNTYRKYIIIGILGLLLYYAHTNNEGTRWALWTFVGVEAIAALYALRFFFIDEKDCKCRN